MPCNCDHMEQTVRERQLQQAAHILVWLEAVGAVHFERKRLLELKKKGAEYYAEDVGQVEQLCDITKTLRETNTLDPLLQANFKDVTVREYLDWIDEHDEEDKRRIAAERRIARDKRLDAVMALVEELSDEDLEAIAESRNLMTAFQPRA